jgi:hypothetical protein
MQHRGATNHAEVWRDTVSVLGEYSPLTFWRTSETERPEFWWAISAAEDDLRDDHVLGFLNPDDPLYYGTIQGAVVFKQHPGNTKEPYPAESWGRLKQDLRDVRGLTVVEVRDVDVPGATFPNEALELRAGIGARGRGR